MLPDKIGAWLAAANKRWCIYRRRKAVEGVLMCPPDEASRALMERLLYGNNMAYHGNDE